MSEEIKQEMPDKVTLSIEFTKEGKINVSGPITNEMLSFYLLEKAKDIIKAHNLGIALKERQVNNEISQLINSPKLTKRF